jgi:MFS family permease
LINLNIFFQMLKLIKFEFEWKYLLNSITCYRVVNETVYVGLSYYGPSIGSDAYLSFFLSTLVEIPGYVLCLLLMDRWGRRLLLCVCMIISGISAMSTALMDEGQF